MVTSQAAWYDRNRYEGNFGVEDDRCGLEHTLRIYGKILVHIFIDLSSRSIGSPNHCSRDRSRQFHETFVPELPNCAIYRLGWFWFNGPSLAGPLKLLGGSTLNNVPVD